MQKAPFKMYLVAVCSSYVRETFVFVPTDNTLKQLDEVTVVVGATASRTKEDAMHKIARNYELPYEMLTAFEVSA